MHVSGVIQKYTIHTRTSDKQMRHPYWIRLSTSLGWVGLFFVPDGEVLPKSHKQAGEDSYFAYFHERHLPFIVDTLRNEKPVYFYFQSSPQFGNFAGITTGEEPVGEEETKEEYFLVP